MTVHVSEFPTYKSKLVERHDFSGFAFLISGVYYIFMYFLKLFS